jgi:hypothetical protein
MSRQPPANGPKNIWQNQKTEREDMSLEEIRRKVRQIQMRNRINLILGIAATIFFGWAVFQVDPAFMRVGFALLTLGALLMAITMSRAVSRTLAEDATAATSIAFYRARLLGFRSIRQVWGWPGTILFLSEVLVVTGGVLVESIIHHPPLRAVAPFFLILAMWAVSFAVIRRRQRQWVQRELRRLDVLEKESE